MRYLVLAISVLFLGCNGSKHTVTTNSVPTALDGTWYPISEEMAGKPLPIEAFGKQRLTLHDSTYSMQAESLDKGIVKYNKEKMDIYGREGVNAGRHITAIYKFSDGQLTVCYNLAGDSYPTSFQTEGKPLYFTAMFKKTTIETSTRQNNNMQLHKMPDPVR